MNLEELQQHIDQAALHMMTMSPDERERAFCGAFALVLEKHPGLTTIPPEVTFYMAAVLQRIAEFERKAGHA